MFRVLSELSVYRAALLCLIMLSLLTGWAAASLEVESPGPGEPPVWPERADVAVVSVDGDYVVYLPLLYRAPSPLWVDTQDREASRALYQADYLGSAGSDSGWTGDHATCGAGTTSEAFRAAILRRINYYRSMAGIPPVAGFGDTYNRKAQAAALMMSVNRTLSHTPNTSWTCYTEDGREGAGSSDLYLGVYGPDAISGYIYDPGSGNYAAGHRRWILYPQTQLMGTGDIPSRDGYPPSNALWVFDHDNMWGARPDTREVFVAWPPPGYVPYQVVYPRWSFSYPQADFGQATVAMTCAGQPLALQQSAVVNGYGENTLVWEPQISFGSAPAADIPCQVTVNDAIVETQPRSFTYTVIVFDPGL
ncbi:MAG: CAP domain-containing protein [Anaerolineae bacterium]|nr:CAP domain-containing protein [Anaerolineae bacterium]